MANHLVEGTKLTPSNTCGFDNKPVQIDYAFKNNGTGEASWPITAKIRLDCLPKEIVNQLIMEGLKRKLGYAQGVNVKGQSNVERAASMGMALQRLYDGQWRAVVAKIGSGSSRLTPQQAIARRLCRDFMRAALNEQHPDLYKDAREEFNQRLGKAVDTYAFDEEMPFMKDAQKELDAKAKAKANAPKFTI